MDFPQSRDRQRLVLHVEPWAKAAVIALRPRGAFDLLRILLEDESDGKAAA